jgi:hypothetical protein
MKANNSFLSAPLILKLVGCIMITSSLLDYVVLLIPFNLQEKTWLVGTITQFVDRGVLPLLGLALLFTGYWLEGGGQDRPNPVMSLRFWTLVLSTLLGALFLVMMPLALVNYNRVSEDQIQEVNKQAEAAENNLQNQVQQNQAQLDGLLKDPKQLEQQMKQLDEQLAQMNAALASGQLKGDQLAELEKRKKELEQVKANPASLGDKVKQARDETLTKIRTEKDQKTEQIKLTAWKTGLRVGMSSLLLTLGYTVIGWFGLRGLLGRRGVSISQ